MRKTMDFFVDRERRRQIEYSFDHLPSLVRMPDSVKEPISDLPEAEDLEIFLLPLHQTDGATGKAMPAYALLTKAEKEGRVYPGCTVVVPSSGNTVLSVGWDMSAFGIEKVIAVMNEDTPEGKKAQLGFPGVTIEHPRPKQTTLERAAEIEKETGAAYLRQYEDWASVEGHKPTMRHIITELQDRGRKLDLISVAMGTCSFLQATHDYLLDEFPGLHIIGVANDGVNTPGARNLTAIKRDIKFPWEDVLRPSGGPVLCDNISAFARSLWLMRRIGRPVGPTTGLSVEGLFRSFRYLSEQKQLGSRKRVAVIVSMDAASSYGPEYAAVLGKDLGGIV
jgi:cysteine synthase